jgi:hypothetical protein
MEQVSRIIDTAPFVPEIYVCASLVTFRSIDRKSNFSIMAKARSLEQLSFKPGELVRASGVYCVEHHSHRLMHTVTLVMDGCFPRCKRCGNAVRFTLLRRVKEAAVFPFRSTAILEEYPAQAEYWRKAS